MPTSRESNASRCLLCREHALHAVNFTAQTTAGTDAGIKNGKLSKEEYLLKRTWQAVLATAAAHKRVTVAQK